MVRVRRFFKNNSLLVANFVIIFGGMIIAMIMAFYILSSVVKQDMETTTRALFDGIYNSVNDKLEYSAQFTKAMCNDYFLQSLLKKEGDTDDAEFEMAIAEYLKGICAVNNWEGAYLISCKTRNYYTPGGIGKAVDSAKDEYDIWYENFIKSGIEYGADLTYDQFNKKEYVIFLDRRMEMGGELRAVLGCAMYLTDITDIMQEYSEKYNVDICFTDIYGNTTLDDQAINLGVAYYSRNHTADMIRENSIYTDEGFIVRKYIPSLGMYLVVKNNQHILSERFLKIFVMMVIYSLSVITLLTIFNFNKFSGEKAALRDKIRTDYLTKISNINGLQNSIQLFIEEEASKGIGATMYIIDVDHFKNVNDSLGHSKGDAVLMKVARGLSKSFRGGDIVGRLGGDEFMVFSPTLTEYEHIVQKAKELNETLRFTVEDGDKSVDITVSIGISTYPHDAETYEELYKTADKALYYVKEHGKNGYCIYSDYQRMNQG